MDILVVVDMQNDFITDSLGTKEAVGIITAVQKKILNFQGKVIFTRDTHEENYLDTFEGKNLPISHCIENTEGWQIRKELLASAKDPILLNKPTFGSVDLAECLKKSDFFSPELDTITLVGLCTDICVITNALLLRTYFYNTPIFVDAACCAGTSPENHKTALAAMKPCQITIVNE